MSDEVQEDTETPVETPEGATDAPEEQPAENTDHLENETPDEPNSEDQAEDSTEEENEESTETSDEDYPDFGDANLNYAVSILKDAGVSPADSDKFFTEAVETGDFSKVDVKALTEALGEDKAKMVMHFAEQAYNTQIQQFQELETQIHDLMGGKEVFELVKDWTGKQEQNDPEFAKDMEELRDMLSSGSLRQAKAAASELFEKFKADPNTTIPAELLQGDSTGAKGLEPLSLREYTARIYKAQADGTYEQVHQILYKQRMLGKQQGI